MKRILLSLVFCSPLLINVPFVQSVDLIGPNDEGQTAQPVETTPTTPTTVNTPTSSPSITQYGPISSQETLWSIASKLRPDSSVSVFQTLVAIYKANPNAFYQGDINRIIPRSVITIPNKAFIAQQTNKEAEQLLRPRKKAVPKPAQPVIAKEVTETAAITPVIDSKEETVEEQEKESLQVVEPDIIEQLKNEALEKAQALEATNQRLLEQEKEFDLLSEQLIVATEANQRLKLQLQPLSDQVNSLAQQVEEDIVTQQQLQALIDQYRQQIEDFVEPPFSGPGLLNEILRTITASVSSLVLTMLTPILLLIAVFLLFLRLKSKRELASKEQEIAESTSILMEEDGQFDSLLTGDLEDEALIQETEAEIDFAADPEVAAVEEPETEKSSIEPDTISDFDIVDSEGSTDNSEQNDAQKADESQADSEDEFIQPETTEDDPFGIAELIESEDFDIDSLIEGKEEIIELSEVDLSLDAEIDQEDLALATEWESELSQESENNQDDTEVESDVNEAEAEPAINEEAAANEVAADLETSPDLEAEAEPTANPEVNEETAANEVAADVQNQTDLETEAESEAKPEVNEEAAANEVAADVDTQTDLEAEADPAANPEVNEEAAANEVAADVETQTDLEAEAKSETKPEVNKEAAANEVAEDVETQSYLEAEAESEAKPEVNENEEADANEVATDVQTQSDFETDAEAKTEVEEEVVLSEDDAVTTADGSADIEPAVTTEDIDDDLSEFENVDLSTLKSVDQSISELDLAEDASATSGDTDFTDQDSELAEQLSQGAFDEDAELPSINKNDDEGFIDIDTLLTNSGGENINEEEFNLEFGLDEFPDVVESFNEFDSDDDGVAAQLDLARAYLEIDEKEGAKDILNKLLTTASDDKLKEVQKLLTKIK